MLRFTGFASVGRLFEQQSVSAVLGICRRFMFDVGYGACLAVAAQQLHLAAAVFAAELGVVVDQGDGDWFYLPERLIASAFFHAASLYFALVNLFAFDC